MNKKKPANDKMKLLGVTLERQRIGILKKLADYMDVNLSELIRGLLPTPAAIDAFKVYQQYADVEPKRILQLFSESNSSFLERLMATHLLHPIRLQARATKYFDKNGIEIFKLYKKFVHALEGKKGYRFETIKSKRKDEKGGFYVVLAPKDKIREVGKLISNYCNENEMSLEDIKASCRDFQISGQLGFFVKELLGVEMRRMLEEGKQKSKKKK